MLLQSRMQDSMFNLNIACGRVEPSGCQPISILRVSRSSPCQGELLLCHDSGSLNVEAAKIRDRRVKQHILDTLPPLIAPTV